MRTRFSSAWLFLFMLSGLLAITARAATPGANPAAPIVQALRAGGYVLVMRHAQSPTTTPDTRAAERDNPQHERQLDDAGKRDAQALGQALRALHMPIGPIYSSPTYRALETLRLAGLKPTRTVPELIEGQRGMQDLIQRGPADAAEARNRWLQGAVRQIPPTGTNTLIVTHTPNVVGAFGDGVANIKPGEMLVFQPRRIGDAPLIGRISIAQWHTLARGP